MTQHETRPDGTQTPICEIWQQLSEDFVFAAREFIDLQTQQTQAVIYGDPDFTRFDDLLHMAREKKDRAKYMLIAHVQAHECL